MIGHEKELDTNSAINFLLQSSSKGNNNPSFALGLLYFNDRLTQKNIKEATKFLRLSVAQGNSMGFNVLGFYYDNGYGVKQDYKKAREYYEKSSELRNSYALNNLGVFTSFSSSSCAIAFPLISILSNLDKMLIAFASPNSAAFL